MEVDQKEFERKLNELNANPEYVKFYMDQIEQMSKDDDDLTNALNSKGH